ncbi:hypothetical protein [Chryseobacterium sp. SIMBA_038]|uniref:hypothetical protein n=1 Tax=Chryseobacterium sp. SIMBA_038 TaxID=3085780 RepID=UPI00397A271E
MKKTLILLAAVLGLQANAQSWNLTGNPGTNPTTNFLGTTDNQPLIFKTNNAEKFRITEGNKIVVQGISTIGSVWDKNLFFAGGNDATTGVLNTVFGFGALTLNTIGASNTAIGANSISSMTNGSYNVAIGVNSLRLSTIGDLNVAVGMKSMEGLGEYVENTAIGYASLARENTMAGDKISYNTALGSRTMAYLKNGQNNIAIGYNAMKLMNSGNSNIAIGNNSGYSLSSGNGNILIGDNVNAKTATSNNELNIGNWIIGNNGTIGIGQFTNQLPADGISSDGERYKLFVKDGIRTEKVKVDIAASNGWADYVFEKDYKLMSLNELSQFINKNGHLPEVPTTKEAIENGIELKEMNILLLKKIEELTLHAIEQQKRIEVLEKKMK